VLFPISASSPRDSRHIAALNRLAGNRLSRDEARRIAANIAPSCRGYCGKP
jgi:hypothetical protein